MRPRLILASGSPQRRAILTQLGVEFSVEVPPVEEGVGGDPRELVSANALLKARAVADAGRAGGGVDPVDAAGGADPAVVLGADTVVAVDGTVLGKPRDEAQARDFLAALSGREHEVWSGLALVEGAVEQVGAAVTRVRFRALDRRDLDWYVATGEWRSRAGGYAIQGSGAALVERVEGDFWNVVGLPVAELMRLRSALVVGQIR